MNIRQATSKDLPEIISVLKASLGEVDLPLSREIWNYKHLENPFGQSLVFIAEEEEGRMAGVRAFMKWKWRKDAKEFTAYRAVDTATHPDFQGKGIFKKLTLKAVETGVDNGDNFVFNTPNDKSKPGYLKMGWIETGKVKVALKPALKSFWMTSKKQVDYRVEKTSSASLNPLCEYWNNELAKKDKVFTPKSQEFLSWRYENNPLQRYHVFSSSSIYLAGYVKNRGRIKELRIAECILEEDKATIKKVKSIITDWSKIFGVQVISYSPDLFLKLPFEIKGDFGPVLTLRKLNLSLKEYDELSKVQNWKYSLGDLELF